MRFVTNNCPRTIQVFAKNLPTRLLFSIQSAIASVCPSLGQASVCIRSHLEPRRGSRSARSGTQGRARRVSDLPARRPARRGSSSPASSARPIGQTRPAPPPCGDKAGFCVCACARARVRISSLSPRAGAGLTDGPQFLGSLSAALVRAREGSARRAPPLFSHRRTLPGSGRRPRRPRLAMDHRHGRRT